METDSLTGQSVSLDRSLVDTIEEHGENETFNGIYLLDDIIQYTISFETNGGSAISPMKVAKGKTLVPPADPTRAYYAFAGWYEDEANSCIYFNPQIESVVTPPSGKTLAGFEIDGVPYSYGDEYLATHLRHKPVVKVDPTCTEGGKEAYYKCEGCGKFFEDARGAKEIADLAAWGNLEKLGHKDDNKDGKCDVCTHNVGTGVTDTNKPSGNVQSPQTGDNSMMGLWSALLFITGLGVVATTATEKKEKIKFNSV